MKLCYFIGVIALGVALAAVPNFVSAQEAAAPPQTAAPAEQPEVKFIFPDELKDPAFAMYVDMRLLEPAWVTKDADLLIDIALQLAEGEKVLMRPHKAGSARDLLKLASSIATRKGNKDAIARIEKVAKARNFEDVAKEASNAAKLAAASRNVDPNLAVQVDQANLRDIADYGLLIDGVQSAEILRDAVWLDDVEKRLDQYQNLTDGQRNYLKKVIGEARNSLGKESDNSVVASIAKLEGEARHCGYDWGQYHQGGHYGGWGHHGGGWDHHGHDWGHYGGDYGHHGGWGDYGHHGGYGHDDYGHGGDYGHHH